MLSRGDTKRLLRRATAERLRLERKEREHLGGHNHGIRMEEKEATTYYGKIPSVFAIAEKMNRNYVRPGWAMSVWGNK